MAFYKSLWGLVSGAAYRQKGQQTGEPSSYSNNSAVPVTMDTALQLSAAWACVRLLAESIASMPIYIYRKNTDGSRVLDTEHPLARLFNGKVNRWQTKQEYFETIAYQLVLTGNDYSAVQRNSQGQIIAIVPLMSLQMEVTLTDSGDLIYKYTDGTNINAYSDKTVWHNKLFGNGTIGLSPLQYARNSLGIGLAAEQAVTNIYQDGGKPSGVLTIDKVLGKEQRDAVRASYAELATGKKNRLFVLEAGMKYQQVSLSPQDIELLASRRFQIEDVCRFFGVPSVLVNDNQNSTTWGSGIQQIVQGFYKLGLRPYLERYEASMKARLLLPEERHLYDIEFDFNALLRPDQAERIKSYKEGVQGGIMTPNEARLAEGWTSKAGGDKLLVQRQMVPLDRIDETVGDKNVKTTTEL